MTSKRHYRGIAHVAWHAFFKWRRASETDRKKIETHYKHLVDKFKRVRDAYKSQQKDV